MEMKKGEAFDQSLLSDKVTEEMGGLAYLADMVRNNSSKKNMVSYARKGCSVGNPSKDNRSLPERYSRTDRHKHELHG